MSRHLCPKAQLDKGKLLDERELEPGLPSTLYRVNQDHWADAATEREEIGSGPLSKMLRIALSDPDAEIWRYSISVAGRTVAGREIARTARELES